MPGNDGDYFVGCDQGHQHWGAYGAAGMLITHTGPGGQSRYLLQRRCEHVQHGGTWSTPGGALHDGERPEDAALREAPDELGELHPGLHHVATHTDDHGGWAYWTVVMAAPEPFERGGEAPVGWESAGHAWVTADEIASLPLHPGFAATWPSLRDGGTGLGPEAE
jgi:8-oxo-dGTP diphosphatase